MVISFAALQAACNGNYDVNIKHMLNELGCSSMRRHFTANWIVCRRLSYHVEFSHLTACHSQYNRAWKMADEKILDTQAVKNNIK